MNNQQTIQELYQLIAERKKIQLKNHILTIYLIRELIKF